MKSLRLKKYFPLFAVLAIALAVIPTVVISQHMQTLRQNAACLANHLHISGPVQLDTKTIPVGGTINATVKYTNDGRCDVYIMDMAIAGRPPGAPRPDPNNQYGKYAFLPEKFNFTVHPGQSVTMNGSLTIQQGWPTGQGWYSYAAYQTGNGNWHDLDNPNIYFTVTNRSNSCTTLSLAQPLQLYKSTVAQGQTIHGSVTYKNTNACDVFVQDLAIGTRAPGQPHSCPQGNCPNFLPGKVNFTLHPGESVTLDASFTPDSSDVPGLWSAYPSYETDNWYDGNSVWYTITGGGSQSCSPQGSCINGAASCPAGTVCSGAPAYGCYPQGCPMPICLSENTLIDTPNGFVKVQNIQQGMQVYSVDGEGNKVAVPVLQVTHTPVPATHTIVHLVLSDGREVYASKGHPTANGLTIDQLKQGDAYNGAVVLKTGIIQYQYQYTYDLLPASDTGYYFANGILLGSTLKKN